MSGHWHLDEEEEKEEEEEEEEQSGSVLPVTHDIDLAILLDQSKEMRWQCAIPPFPQPQGKIRGGVLRKMRGLPSAGSECSGTKEDVKMVRTLK